MQVYLVLGAFVFVVLRSRLSTVFVVLALRSDRGTVDGRMLLLRRVFRRHHCSDRWSSGVFRRRGRIRLLDA